MEKLAAADPALGELAKSPGQPMPRVNAAAKKRIEFANVTAKLRTLEAAAVLGFTSAVGACGGFLIPRSFGASIKATGSAEAALFVFLAFYVTCIAITWWFYARRATEPAAELAHSLAQGRV